MTRRGFNVTTNLFQYARCVLECPLAHRSRNIVVLESINDKTKEPNVVFLFARIRGGFVTTEQWLIQSFRKQRTRPRGWVHPGVLSQTLQLHLSPALAAKCPELIDLMRVLHVHERSEIIYKTEFGQLREAYEAAIRTGGLRSRPFLKVNCWCLDKMDAKTVAETVPDVLQRIATPCSDFLAAKSKAQVSAAPGFWP